jgi:hypothetical protein
MREVVYEFYGSRYAACLARLQRLLPLLRLDLHLAPHVDHLHAQARPSTRRRVVPGLTCCGSLRGARCVRFPGPTQLSKLGLHLYASTLVSLK